MADPWDAFPDAPVGDDPWAGFPDAPDEKPRRRRKSKRKRDIVEGEALADPSATDGDTIKADQGSVRLVGVDAPELRQRGWDMHGNPVSIGANSQAYLDDFLGGGPSIVGPSFGQSWGRTVAPITVGTNDAGRMVLRYGHGLAAPEYLIEAPERRAHYLQDERLARLNGLGMHDTQFQPPAEYRENPAAGPAQLQQYDAPERETVPMWWDTPTPFDGLPREIEAQYSALLKTGTVEQLTGFLDKHGYETREADLREWVKDRDAGKDVGFAISYEKPPPLLIDSGDGGSGAFGRKFTSGFLAGGLDEAGAVFDTLGLTPGRESVWNSDRRMADIWSNNQRQNAGILSYDQEHHPWASTAGEVTGAITSGFVIPYGAGARTVPQLAKVGAGWGAAEGFLGTDGTVSERLTGAAIGAPIGAVANPVLGRTVEAVAPIVARGVANARTNLASDVSSVRSRFGTGAAARDEWADFPDADSPSTVAMVAEDPPSLSVSAPPGAFAQARGLLEPTTKAQLMASAANVQPSNVVPLPSNAIDGVEEAVLKDAGRFVEAKAPDERSLLGRRTVRNFMGAEVPKVGPVDMVGWLRLNGGLRDSGGELAAMDVTNAPRRGMDFVGQEARFGPMLNPDSGMDFDDAALAAWEAGYFPELSERPTINQFLDAFRDTYEGQTGRRFLPEDAPEIESYYDAQGERYDLEQQRYDAGQPIYSDLSAPADDAAPFPPPQAYEEWPSEAIERVGNIDVTKLDTPQDIRRALKTTHNALGGFDSATRGRIANAETERLASELNMTPENLLSRRKGQAFNAEEALAARQILAKSGNELVNAAKRIQRLDDPGDELLAEFRHKWMRHVAIQEQVSGMTAEAGRALGQFKMAASSRAVRGDVLGALVRAGGGRGNLKEAADILIDAVEMGPGKFNAWAEKAAKPKWRNKLSELYINMLLSNPPTHVVNMVSNTLTAMLQVPEFATASVIGAARKAARGERAKERILASEVGARALGLIQGTKEGAHLFAQALRTGDADDFVSKVEGDEFKAISGLKGEVIRIPTRLLTAEDQLFKGIARRMELNAQAVRIASREGLRGEAAKQRIGELVANPTDDMLERAFDYGRYLTFQRQLGEFGQGLSRITGSNLLAKVVVPFVRTPINLLKFATERSVAAPLLKEWRADFRAGGERRDLAFARSLMGTGFAAVIYEAALDGTITGAVPPDPAKAKLLYADGWQPYSIKIGDRYVSYSRVDPLATTIGVAADMATLPSGLSDRQKDDQATMLVASIMGNLASKTWLSGMSSFVEGLADPGRYAESWIQRTVGSFTVPAGVAGVARAIDPVSRKRENLGDAVKARVPGMSDDLLPRRNVFGEPLVNDSLGPDFLSPFWQSKAKNDPVVAEMLRIGKGVSAPGKQYTEDGERLDYSPEQYDRYHEIAGRLTYNVLLGLVGSREYTQLDDAGRRKAAKKAIAKARKAARGLLADPDYPLPEKGAQGAQGSGWDAFPDADDGQPDEADPWSDFPDAEQRDVVGSLRSAIPGVGMSSGYRTEDYQEDMKRRGYKPAENSAHLDGSALDLTPPPGRSMGWLMREVQKVEPEAYLLPEGDHLHVIFPDWQGAPVLGGARSAGLANPAAR